MKALDQIDAKLDRVWKVREDRKKARVRQFNAKHGVKPMSAHTPPCNLGSIPFGGVVLPKVTIHTMANAVHTALTRLQSARSEEEATAANRQFYQVLADTCRAYLGQFVDASGLARQGPAAKPFPPEAANLLLHMIEGWLVGRMDQSLKDLVRRAGTPGHTLRARNDIEAACRYMQATKGATPLIQDGSAQKRVGEWFGVDRSTAQAWNRNETRDLLTDYMPNASVSRRAAIIKHRAIDAGRRYARFGRGQKAINRRGRRSV